jgi:hypothetical protein
LRTEISASAIRIQEQKKSKPQSETKQMLEEWQVFPFEPYFGHPVIQTWKRRMDTPTFTRWYHGDTSDGRRLCTAGLFAEYHLPVLHNQYRTSRWGMSGTVARGSLPPAAARIEKEKPA